MVTLRIGYMGLGNMGGPLAQRLLLRHPLLVHDRDPAAVQRLVALGATAATDAADLAARCDVLLLCLPTTEHVRSLVFGARGIAGAARPGTLVLDQTTGDPVATRAMVPELESAGLDFVDAPVSGGPEAAHAGTISIMVGATPELFARAEPVLRVISPKVFHAGAFGTGYVAKLANNMLFSATRLATLEAVALAAKNGIEPRRAAEILLAGSSRNFFMEHTLLPRILSGELASGFTLELAHKDVRLATQLGVETEVTLLIGNLVREFYQMCISELGRDVQVNATALVMDRLAGTQMVPPEGARG